MCLRVCVCGCVSEVGEVSKVGEVSEVSEWVSVFARVCAGS